MIPNTWSKELYFSHRLEGRSPPQSSSFHLGTKVEVPDIYFNGSDASSHVMHYLGHEAKRARVENIIDGMCDSSDVPNANPQWLMQDDTSKTVSSYQNQMEMFEMHQLQNQYQFCKQDEVKKSQDESKVVEKTVWGPRDLFIDVHHEVQPINYSQLKAEKVKLMKDVLKCELSKALSTSVDSIFKTKTKQETSEPNLHHLLSPGTHCFNEIIALPGPATQTEALSLVVRRDKFHPVSENSTHCELKYSQTSPKSLRQRGFEKEQLDMTDRCWRPIKVKSKVDPRAGKSLYAVGHVAMKSLPLSRVRQSPGTSSSSRNMDTVNLEEGLTTHHLKKAKLMFFYTRYPSSFVLKMCFSDVQFTRCITSQLIKWFSNFREFFYIQMEKFARHAVLQGAGGDGALTVGRESELFRVLNLHYNKTSDFQVPDRFLEVAEITLREFYIAICLGRDQDPSWKKAIYRVIGKLDSDVPAHLILT